MKNGFNVRSFARRNAALFIALLFLAALDAVSYIVSGSPGDAAYWGDSFHLPIRLEICNYLMRGSFIAAMPVVGILFFRFHKEMRGTGTPTGTPTRLVSPARTDWIRRMA